MQRRPVVISIIWLSAATLTSTEGSGDKLYCLMTNTTGSNFILFYVGDLPNNYGNSA